MPNPNKPEPGKIYALTGGTGKKSIAAGNTWAESEVKDELKSMTIISFDENSVPTKTEVSAKDLMDLRLDPNKPIKIVGPFNGDGTKKESN
tara:strand:- start:41 stop:313 length:273 start_codon:yes stop_codon:yes gene_type:complete